MLKDKSPSARGPADAWAGWHSREKPPQTLHVQRHGENFHPVRLVGKHLAVHRGWATGNQEPPTGAHRCPSGTQHQLSISPQRELVLYWREALASFPGSLAELTSIPRSITSRLSWTAASHTLNLSLFPDPFSGSPLTVPIPSPQQTSFGCCWMLLLNPLTQGMKEAHFRASNQLLLWIKLQTKIVPICLNNPRKMGPKLSNFGLST